MTTLILFTTGWILLAFLPSLRELIKPTDDSALDIDDLYPSDWHKIAKSGAVITTGDESLTLSGKPDSKVLRLAFSSGKIVRSESGLNVAGQFVDRLHVKGDLNLRKGSRVGRWAHATGKMNISKGAALQGSVSAGQHLQLDADSSFERLAAPVIGFGSEFESNRVESDDFTLTDCDELGVRNEHIGNVCMVTDDLTLPENYRLDGDIVIHGNCVLDQNSCLCGNVKVRGSITLKNGSRIKGNLFATQNIELHDSTHVGGVVVSESNLEVHSGAEIGSPEAPVSVSAHSILMAPGSRVSGSVAAIESGQVNHIQSPKTTRNHAA